jgi:hypothetical protein
VASFEDSVQIPPQRERGRRVYAPQFEEFYEDEAPARGVPTCVLKPEDEESTRPFVSGGTSELTWPRFVPAPADPQEFDSNESPLSGGWNPRPEYGLTLQPADRNQPTAP